MDSRRTVLSAVFLFSLSALVMSRQLVSQDFFSCSLIDSYQYSSWAWQFAAALKEGIVYPRWTPLSFWGYGSPTFVLYPPLAFYLVALFNVFTGSIITAMSLTKVLSLFVSSTGTFLLIRELYSERVALLTASFSVLLPFHIFNLYIGGAFTSSVSLMWFPLIVFFIVRFIRSGRYNHLFYSGACYGGLILTHLINAYMFAFVVVTLSVYMSVAKKSAKCLAAVPSVILSGALVSAAYLLPFIVEKDLIGYRSVLKDFPFTDLFILPRHTDKFQSDFFWTVYYDEYIIYVALSFAITLLLFLSVKKSEAGAFKDTGPITHYFFGASFFSMFLLFGPSTVLWNAVPFFKYINIPIRWLNITAFAVVFLSAWGFSRLEMSLMPIRTRLLILSFIFLTCALLDYRYAGSACTLDAKELTPARSVDWAVEHLPTGADIEKVRAVGNSGGRVTIVRGNGEVEVKAWKSVERVIRLEAYRPVTLRVGTFDFPGWTADIDGKETRIRTEKGSDAMLIDVPAGRHVVKVNFVDTPIRRYSKFISSLSLFSVVCLAPLLKKGRRSKVVL